MVPKIRIDGNYHMQGRILVIPLNGHGKCWFETSNNVIYSYGCGLFSSIQLGKLVCAFFSHKTPDVLALVAQLLLNSLFLDTKKK